MRKKNYLLGLDEVGRGPLAGPLVVGAVLIPIGYKFNKRGLRDSKKLNETGRNDWSTRIKSDPRMHFALARVGHRVIDRINVSCAANLAARRAALKVVTTAGVNIEDCEVYLDGGLYLGNKSGRLPGRTLVKGDEKIPVIALASILAKVDRDAIMVRQEKLLPGYDFETHKGYGTKNHYAALRRLGPSPIHRLTFLKKWNSIESKYHGWRTNKTS